MKNSCLFTHLLLCAVFFPDIIHLHVSFNNFFWLRSQGTDLTLGWPDGFYFPQDNSDTHRRPLLYNQGCKSSNEKTGFVTLDYKNIQQMLKNLLNRTGV